MPTYYCHKCAAVHGYLGFDVGTLTDTSYQLGKYMKHTVPDPNLATQLVFNSPSTQAYENYVVSSSLSGSVEIDDGGRRNVIWAAGNAIGFKQEHGVLKHPEDCVKVVLSTDTGRIHAYSQSSTEFSGSNCDDCGGGVIF